MKNLYCSDCRNKFVVKDFEKGKTVCPRCGFSSFLDVDKNQTVDKPRTLKKTEIGKIVCDSCNISWVPPEGDAVCPKCLQSKGLHLEVLKV